MAVTQLLVTVFLGVVLYFSTDLLNAISAFAGGIIAAAANLYMALRMWSGKRKQPASEMLARFYTSVVLKVIFTLSMMIISIIVIKVSIAPFIISYLLVAVAVNLLFLLVPTNDVVVREDRKTHHEKI
ncbi:ATP synthase subunit I [Arenicella chitinivorans]|uniref:ATP synthase subunit I n=1 Tax=Arenicella chitinivorans TaxID=1329800 RepID=UPI001676FE9E|nr:ATP synthase subunit I [Arenicella chitinivorans]